MKLRVIFCKPNPMPTPIAPAKTASAELRARHRRVHRGYRGRGGGIQNTGQSARLPAKAVAAAIAVHARIDESLVHSQRLAEAACLGLNRTPYRPRNLRSRPQSAFRGVQASRLMARWIDFGKVRGFTHRTSHSTVLRGVDDCLADCYYPGAGSGAFAKLPISIVFVNRPPHFANPLWEPSEPAFAKAEPCRERGTLFQRLRETSGQCQTMFDLPHSSELCP